MKTFQRIGVLSILAAACACQSHQANDRTSESSARMPVTTPRSPRQPAATMSTRPILQAWTTRHAAHIPKNFSEYGAHSMDNGEHCVVGDTTDDDGMNAHAVAYVIDATATQPTWVDTLNLPPDTYQSRATHCTSSGRALFVLLQSDTRPEQTLSQTLLRVVRLDPATGAVQVQRDIQVPGAFSAWVELGPGHFQWKGGVLTVSGGRRPESSPDRQTTFKAHRDNDLNPVQDAQP
jgi:hypothetical protein